MSQFFGQFLRLFGYAVVANAFTPLPSDAVSVTLGYGANLYGAPLVLAIFAGITSMLLIDLIFYSSFRFFGRRLQLVEKIFRHKLVETYSSKMAGNVGKTVLFLRFYPGPGILSPILAGSLKIPAAKYLLYDMLGIGISNIIYVTIGDLFHSSITVFMKEIGYEKHLASIALIVVAGLVISWHIYSTYLEKISTQRLRQILLMLQHPVKDDMPDGGRGREHE